MSAGDMQVKLIPIAGRNFADRGQMTRADIEPDGSNRRVDGGLQIDHKRVTPVGIAIRSRYGFPE